MLKDCYNNFLILDRNFLSEQECSDIKNKIIVSQNLYQTSEIVSYFNYLPLGLYLCTPNNYSNSVLKYKTPMFDLFGQYYIKLKNTLEINLGINLDYHDNLHFPGFHISNGTQMRTPNFHRDFFPSFSNFLVEKKVKFYYTSAKILSVILVISVPKKGTGLLVRKHPSLYDIERYKLTYDYEYDYQIGMLAIWDGKLMHSIKPFFPISDSDYRITMQCHLAVIKNQGIIFW